MLPVIDILTDNIFAILNTNSAIPAIAAVGFASVLNLVFGPMIFGKSKRNSQIIFRLFKLPEIFFMRTITNFHEIFEVAVYGDEIRYEWSQKLGSNKSLSVLKRIMSILFSSFIFLIEEVQNVFIFYKDCKLIQSLRKEHDRFMNLSLHQKTAVRTFFNVKVRRLDDAQKLICRESSIQVVLQFTLILYQANF